ncbi:hypothetical protein ACJZ2D_010386 [Fusarium nematophilum]
MRTARLPGFQTAAEFESVSTYNYLSIRMRARVTGSPGACMAMFTYLEGEQLADVQEADIEILTRDPRSRIQYTNQPSFTDDGDEVPKATRNASLPDGVGWDDWVVHRLDWTPERSVWYAAGHEVASIAFQTPEDPAQVLFNAWSDGGEWSGNMSLTGAAYMQIQWIEMVYNSTSEGEDRRGLGGTSLGRDVVQRSTLARREDDGCRVVCSIDEADEVGKAKVLWKSAAPRVTMDFLGAYARSQSGQMGYKSHAWKGTTPLNRPKIALRPLDCHTNASVSVLDLGILHIITNAKVLYTKRLQALVQP